MKRRFQKHTDRTYRPTLTCKSKVQYDTEAKARKAADFHMLENMNIELDVYQCDVCFKWHLTRIKTK